MCFPARPLILTSIRFCQFCWLPFIFSHCFSIPPLLFLHPSPSVCLSICFSWFQMFSHLFSSFHIFCHSFPSTRFPAHSFTLTLTLSQSIYFNAFSSCSFSLLPAHFSPLSIFPFPISVLACLLRMTAFCAVLVRQRMDDRGRGMLRVVSGGLPCLAWTVWPSSVRCKATAWKRHSSKHPNSVMTDLAG